MWYKGGVPLRKSDISPLRGSWRLPANQLVEGDLQGFCDVEKRLDRRIGCDAVLHLQVGAQRHVCFTGRLILGQSGFVSQFFYILRYQQFEM